VSSTATGPHTAPAAPMQGSHGYKTQGTPWGRRPGIARGPAHPRSRPARDAHVDRSRGTGAGPSGAEGRELFPWEVSISLLEGRGLRAHHAGRHRGQAGRGSDGFQAHLLGRATVIATDLQGTVTLEQVRRATVRLVERGTGPCRGAAVQSRNAEVAGKIMDPA